MTNTDKIVAFITNRWPEAQFVLPQHMLDDWDEKPPMTEEQVEAEAQWLWRYCYANPERIQKMTREDVLHADFRHLNEWVITHIMGWKILDGLSKDEPRPYCVYDKWRGIGPGYFLHRPTGDYRHWHPAEYLSDAFEAVRHWCEVRNKSDFHLFYDCGEPNQEPHWHAHLTGPTDAQARPHEPQVAICRALLLAWLEQQTTGETDHATAHHD